NPAAVRTATATVNCQASIRTEWDASGGCSPDGGAWPVPIPQILDAGEIVSFSVLVYNLEPRDLTNATLTLTSTSNPMVVALTTGPQVLGRTGTIPRYTGAGAATFQVAASRFLAAGSVDLTFQLAADGFT